MRRRNKAPVRLPYMIEHNMGRYTSPLVEPRDKGRDAFNSLKTQSPRQLAVTTDNQRGSNRFRHALAQTHPTPIKPVQLLQLTPRSLADLRFARFPQSQPANPSH